MIKFVVIVILCSNLFVFASNASNNLHYIECLKSFEPNSATKDYKEYISIKKYIVIPYFKNSSPGFILLSPGQIRWFDLSQIKKYLLQTNNPYNPDIDGKSYDNYFVSLPELKLAFYNFQGSFKVNDATNRSAQKKIKKATAQFEQLKGYQDVSEKELSLYVQKILKNAVETRIKRAKEGEMNSVEEYWYRKVQKDLKECNKSMLSREIDNFLKTLYEKAPNKNCILD